MKKETQINNLNEMLNHLQDKVEDALDGKLEYSTIDIMFEGERVSIPLNADSYTRLEEFLKEEINELQELINDRR